MNFRRVPLVKPRFLLVAILLAVGAGALAFRLPRLGRRPMHADEAVQAAIFRDLWQQGRYVYRPEEFHGPTLPYATLPSAWLGDAETFAETTEATYRIVPVLFGTGMVLLVLLLADGLGRPAAVCAAVLLAVSPAMVFYSRYYIHETLLVFFTLAAIGLGWRWVQSGRLAWCLGAGACVGLMQATKETAVVAYAAAALGAVLVWLSGGLSQSSRSEHGTVPFQLQDAPRRPWWHWVLGLGAALLVAAFLYSSCFTNPRGPLDAVLTYVTWAGRAAGESPHVHPWYEYLHRLGYWRLGDGPWWSEGLILGLAGVGLVASWLPGKRLLTGASVPLVRWLGFYTVALVVGYSAIPYKTPWCVLTMLQGMALLAGVGAVVLVRAVPTRPLKVFAGLLLLAAAGQLGWQAYQASYVIPAHPSNPYVYAQTSPGIEQLARKVDELAQASPDGYATPVKIVWRDGYYWPLPWYLRRFGHVEPWTRVPDDPTAPIVISSPKHDAALTARLDATHLMTGYYEIRPGVLAMLWVRMDLWEAHLKRLGRL